MNMKKTKILGILLAGVMSVTGVPYIVQPLTTVASAENLLPAPKVTVDYVSSDYAKLKWNVVKGADAYKVLKYNSKTGKYETFAETMATECHISGLSPKTVYKFKVTALRTSGRNSTEQTRSETITVTTKGIEAPVSISVSVESDSVTLKWYRSSQAAAYRIYKYNSKKGKFVKYKDVTETQCTISGLTEGKTYKFRIASLAKSGSKYTVQEKTPVIIASPVKGAEFSLPDFPEYGMTGAEAIKYMGVSSYTIGEYSYGGTMYVIGDDLMHSYGLSANTIGLLVNSNDVYYGALMMKTTASGDKKILAALKKKNGEPKLVRDHTIDMYVWETKEDIKLATFQSGMIVYVEVSKKYTPKEMLDELKESLNKTENVSSEV